MSTRITSDIIWGVLWLGLFLALELTAKDITGLAPWNSLSETARFNEESYPWLRTVLLGFLIGLAVHIRYPVTLWEGVAGGVLCAIAINLLWF